MPASRHHCGGIGTPLNRGVLQNPHPDKMTADSEHEVLGVLP